MDLDLLQRFFMWCTIVSFGIYLLSAISVFTFRGFVLALHKKLFRMSEDAVDLAMHQYLGTFKLLTIIFFLVPWLALAIIR